MPNNRVRLIAGNWKMNNGVADAAALAEAIVAAIPSIPEGVEVLVCPPAVDLTTVASKIEGTGIKLGAQNAYWEAKGAYTGETSPSMVKSTGATYCIIGHSERRGYFGETDEDENRKAKALVAEGITPVFCCGEALEVRKAGEQASFVLSQIKAGLAGLELESPDQLVIAYEPIWAIGTGMNATAADAEEVCGGIRGTLAEMFGEELAQGVRILYGGSANPGNIAGFLAEEDVDGALIGGASLKADGFASMVETAGR